MRTRLPDLLLALPCVAALLAALAACVGPVPADPGLNAKQRGTPAPFVATAAGAPAAVPEADPATRALYLERCGRCHAPFPPTHVPASAWPRFVRHYGPRAGLFGAERERVLRWLQANAR